MLSQIAPGFDVFSAGIFPILLPAILVGGALYFAASLAQGRTSFRTEATGSGPARAENPVLGTLYALALAVLVAAFVGFGIEAVYPTPEPPQDTSLAGGGSSALTPDTGNALPGADTPSGAPGDILPGTPDDAAVATYNQDLTGHDRFASVAAIVVAILILAAGLTPGVSQLPVIGDGVILGGVLTLFYGMTLAAQTASGLLEFFVVAAGLIALLATLYLKYRPDRRTAGS